MTLPLTHPGARPSLLSEMLGLVVAPAKAYPLLLERGKNLEVLLLSGISGIYVAYAAAERLHLADPLTLAGAIAGILVFGFAMGLVALFFAAGILSWSAERFRGTPTQERMYAAFGYSTWPFVPLLIVIVPIQLAVYGGALFSSARPPAPLGAMIVVRALELATILLWLYLMVRGVGVAAGIPGAAAAKVVALTALELLVIAVLLAGILFVSFLI